MAKEHKSRYPKLLDNGIELDCRLGYNRVITSMSKDLIKTISDFIKDKNTK